MIQIYKYILTTHVIVSLLNTAAYKLLLMVLLTRMYSLRILETFNIIEQCPKQSSSMFSGDIVYKEAFSHELQFVLFRQTLTYIFILSCLFIKFLHSNKL